MGKQITKHILMVRPAYFGHNPETAASNSFQQKGDDSPAEIREKAVEEFDGLVTVLKDAGMNIWIYDEPLTSELTDSVFPNNWFSTHQDGTLITYPMLSAPRREERRPEIIEYIGEHFHINKRVRLEHHEEKSRYLEGTGCMILDKENRIAFACNSPRINNRVFEEFCFIKGYEPYTFDAVDDKGLPIYHTNVIMSIGKKLCVISGECITDQVQKETIFQRLKESGRAIIDISLKQVREFAGNILEVENESGDSLLAMSSQAHAAFTPAQLEVINTHCQIIHSPIPTIELYGGGGVRCMMAEIFLPKKII